MAETLAINQCTAGIGWNLANSTSLGVDATHNSAANYSKTFTTGTGAGKAQKLFVDLVTISGSGTQAYDFSGSLTDPLGQTTVFTNIKGVYLEYVTTSTTGKVTVRGNFLFSTGSASPVILGTATVGTDGLQIHPGGCWFFSTGTTTAAGYTVTNSSADTITLVNGDASSVQVKVVVFGE